MSEDERSCPLCLTPQCLRSSGSDGFRHYFCPQCGEYHYYVHSGLNSGNRHILAGYMYENKKENEEIRVYLRKLNRENVANILNDSRIPNTSMQKLDKLLLNIYQSGNGFNIRFSHHDIPAAAGYARDKNELYKMIRALEDLRYIIEKNYAGDDGYDITIHGLQHAEDLLSGKVNSNKVFVAMRFVPELREVHETAIKVACKECGFEAFTVNEGEYNNDIMDQIISGIKSARFVIADFTYNNQGVYYEAGYARGLGREVIKMCNKTWFEDPTIDENGKKIHKLHFDIEHDNLLLWDNPDELKVKLINRINATIL